MKAKKRSFPIGTLASLSSPFPVFGIVIDEEIWKCETTKENSEMVQHYKEADEGRNLSLIPMMLFGRVLSSKLGFEEEGDNKAPKEVPYVQKYIYSNAEGHVSIIPSRDTLRLIIDYALDFTGGHNRIAQYLEEAKDDLIVLESYMEWLQLGTEIPNNLRSGLLSLLKEALPKERLGIRT
ncbi:hypothetical protein HN784_03590 [bacterium]|jgi:hypothetical protein|nr:hypothetical protein [bacterium]MBT4251378.1 hypothetical protein [bacterium]MBT4598241.1 hypothetical protein [bacterium]MBT6754074.1 hypothetical protein [bacterium]MBT7037894.1 hypothetical protein [bacterium]